MTRSEYIRLLENPYASIDVAEEGDSKHQALLISQNPYATHYYFGEGAENVARSEDEGRKESGESAKNKEVGFSESETKQRGVSALKFESECRAIFRMYLPLGQHMLRSEHRKFIKEGKGRPAKQRAAILGRLSRYDIRRFGALNPQLNRERSEQLTKKLDEILNGPEATGCQGENS